MPTTKDRISVDVWRGVAIVAIGLSLTTFLLIPTYSYYESQFSVFEGALGTYMFQGTSNLSASPLFAAWLMIVGAVASVIVGLACILSIIPTGGATPQEVRSRVNKLALVTSASGVMVMAGAFATGIEAEFIGLTPIGLSGFSFVVELCLGLVLEIAGLSLSDGKASGEGDRGGSR